jgi:hypothetical protein
MVGTMIRATLPPWRWRVALSAAGRFGILISIRTIEGEREWFGW